MAALSTASPHGFLCLVLFSFDVMIIELQETYCVSALFTLFSTSPEASTCTKQRVPLCRAHSGRLRSVQLVLSLTQLLLHSSSFLIFDETNVGGGSGLCGYVLACCGMVGTPNFAVVLFILKYVDMDPFEYTSAPDPQEGRGEMAMAMLRRCVVRLAGSTSDAVPSFSSSARGEEGAAGVTFQLPDGRHAGPSSVPVRYGVCSRVIGNSDLDRS